MSLKVHLVDSATGARAKILQAGEQVVAPRHFSTPVSIKLDVINTASNFASAVAGQKYIITDIVMTADKNVTTDALVEIYEGATATTTTADKTIFKIEILKNTSLALTGLNWEVSSGKYLNAKTDDDDIFMTIAYHIHPDTGAAPNVVAGLGKGENA